MLSNSFVKDVDKIRRDTASGAAKIAEDCLQTLKRECVRRPILSLNRSLLKTAIQMLLNTHPMATIENALFPVYLRLAEILRANENSNRRGVVEMVFNTHIDHLRQGEKRTINTLAEILRPIDKLLTFSYSSTVIKALLQLASSEDHDKDIYVLESRPLKEGERTARTLANAGFNVTLGVDFAVNEFSQQVTTAVLGCDTIHTHNGNILNKIGSATIAQVFNTQSKDVIVAGSFSKVCLSGLLFSHDPTWDMPITERNPKEVSSIVGPNLVVWNKYFELIPPEYVTLLVLDKFEIPSPITDHIPKFVEKNYGVASHIDDLREVWLGAEYSVV
ncbi:MAG: hypothetical protein ACFFFG_11110 [Candidatus Thorarchaeota archaeon]